MANSKKIQYSMMKTEYRTEYKYFKDWVIDRHYKTLRGAEIGLRKLHSEKRCADGSFYCQMRMVKRQSLEIVQLEVIA